MTKTLKVCTRNIFHQYWKVSIIVWVLALTAQAANAQQAATDAEKAASDKRAEKQAMHNNRPKSISITELQQRKAALNPPQNLPQQAPVASAKKVAPAVAAPAAAKADTKTDPKYGSRSAANNTGKPAVQTPPVGGNSTSNSQTPIQ